MCVYVCSFTENYTLKLMFKSVDSDTRAVSRFNQSRARLQVITRSREFSVSPDLCVFQNRKGLCSLLKGWLAGDECLSSKGNANVPCSGVERCSALVVGRATGAN